jgi:serine/threonine protein kinase/tetratricopeptide (TPR) repeat protein
LTTIGRFLLRSPLGRGGMGEVWRATPEGGGPDVALKLVRTRADTRTFRREVRAAAKLRHPGIAMILDHGLVDADVTLGTVTIAAGSPYLAMELAAGGALDRFPRPLRWTELRSVLLALLDALAHAHAHGVIHRDIKVGNILLVSEDPKQGIKLTDFGIAHALGDGDPDTAESVAGTLHYMAPEQVTGEWRDFGPWTDLYAVGCLAWRLASGRNPFAGRKGKDLMTAQLVEEPPPVVARVPVPDGYADWVAALLRKSRHKRFQRAADAAVALRRLGEPTGGDGVWHGVTLDDPTLAPDEAMTIETTARRLASKPAGDARTPPPAPIPPSWRRPVPPPPPPALVSAGLALFGVRTVPLVGREGERDLLWNELRAVAASGKPRFVALRGPSGIGKSALAEWLVRQSHELGAAAAMTGRFTLSEGPTDALRRMVASYFLVAGCTRDETRDRIASWLLARGVDDAHEVDNLVELLHPGGPWALESPRQRRAVLRRLFARIAAERPLIVFLDDVPYGDDGLALAQACLADDDRLPVLFVATAHDEALASGPVATRLDVILLLDRTRVVGLGPLPATERADLLRELLALEPPLAARIEDRSAGSPLFAAQMVRDAVDRGVLELGPDGFRLAEGADLALPTDLRDVWTRTVTRVVAGLAPDARTWLWRAAILGMQVDRDEWAELCGGKGTSAREELVERLLGMRLADATDHGFRFAHGVLREALHREAADAGVAAAIHAEAAAMLANREGSGIAERLGMHLLDAGRLEASIDPLLQGVRERERTTGIRPALALLAVATDALVRLDAPATDPRWGRVWMTRGDLHRQEGDLTAAVTWLEKGLGAAREHGWDRERADLLFFLCSCRTGLGRTGPELDALLEEWRALVEALGDPELRGKYHYHLAASGYHRPPDERIASLERALAEFESVGAVRGQATTLRNLAMEASLQGNDHKSLALHAKALALFQSIGQRTMMAICINGFAESYRRLGLLDRAEAEYERALGLYLAVGDAESTYPRLNLAILAILRQDWTTASHRIEVARREVDRQGRVAMMAVVRALMLAPAAGLADWGTFDRALASLRTASQHLVDPDVAEVAGIAARVASAAKEPRRAAAAARIAATAWRGLGREDEAKRVEAG